MLDGLPISLDHNRVPRRLLPAVAELDFSTASLYEALEREGNPLARADYELEARAAEAAEAELLGLAPGAPVLFASTIAIAGDGRVMDLGRTIYRADRYRFQATLMRRGHRERESSHEETIAPRSLAGRPGDRHRRLRRDAGRGQAERAGGGNPG